jgi:STE24 endopeptidase
MKTISDETENDTPESKVYGSIKLRLTVVGIVIDILLLVLWGFTPLSRFCVNYIEYRFENPYLQFVIFMMLCGGSFFVIGTFLSWYSSFIIEHEFHLSNQTALQWIVEQIKSTVLSVVIALPLGLLFFALIRRFENSWWLFFAAAIFLVSVVLARIAPSVIFPLFYKFTPLAEGEVRTGIESLLAKEKLSCRGIYSFNMSKNTRKANAAFAGIGKSRRIILSDTLLESFTPAEIETIFAHELGHLRGGHILKSILLNGAVIFGSFFICGKIYAAVILDMGFIHAYDIAALPVFAFFLSILGIIIMPVSNAFSRRLEREADNYAIIASQNPSAFITALDKLALINNAERNPPVVAEFLFHSHPSIAKRIQQARRGIERISASPVSE